MRIIIANGSVRLSPMFFCLRRLFPLSFARPNITCAGFLENHHHLHICIVQHRSLVTPTVLSAETMQMFTIHHGCVDDDQHPSSSPKRKVVTRGEQRARGATHAVAAPADKRAAAANLKETMVVMLLCGAFATTDLQKSEAEGKFNCFRRLGLVLWPGAAVSDFNNRVPPLTSIDFEVGAP